MPARVVVIGLDAAEATLIEQWAREGYMPVFAALQARAAVRRLSNSLTTLPGSIWPELETGVSAGTLGIFYHPGQLHTGEARVRPVTAADVDASQYYWNVASWAGRRVAVIDQVQTVRGEGINGVQVFEWGLHDRTFPIATEPPELLQELRARHGDHQVGSCDHFHGGSRAGYLRLRDALLEGTRRKTALVVDVMGREKWDLVACTFSESHCAGHQFWHFHDTTHPAHPSDAVELHDALRTVYQQLDSAVGAVMQAAGADAQVLVVASHGMEPYWGGPQLLPEVLHRLGLGDALPWYKPASARLPPALRRAIKRLLPFPIPKHLQVGNDPRHDVMTGRAMALHNNRCGAIRLNLVGREPHGTVQPGADAEALIATLRRELHALTDPASGEPIARRVVTVEEAFGPNHHRDLPDLMIDFRQDLGFLESCASNSVGVVTVPINAGLDPRTGDHGLQSRLWSVGPRLSLARQLPDANVLDLAPTVLRLLNVEVPEWIDGQPLALS